MKRIAITLLLLALALPAGAATIELQVNGLVCAFCAQGISKTLERFPATRDVYVSLEHHVVAVALQPGQDIPDADLKRGITDAGYTVVSVSRTERTLDEIRKSKDTHD